MRMVLIIVISAYFAHCFAADASMTLPQETQGQTINYSLLGNDSFLGYHESTFSYDENIIKGLLGNEKSFRIDEMYIQPSETLESFNISYLEVAFNSFILYLLNLL